MDGSGGAWDDDPRPSHACNMPVYAIFDNDHLYYDDGPAFLLLQMNYLLIPELNRSLRRILLESFFSWFSSSLTRLTALSNQGCLTYMTQLNLERFTKR